MAGAGGRRAAAEAAAATAGAGAAATATAAASAAAGTGADSGRLQILTKKKQRSETLPGLEEGMSLRGVAGKAGLFW